MESATFTITKNKNKQNVNEPDWIINYSFNRKNENYRRSRVGAIWDKQKDDLQYKQGHIESPIFPNGRLYFSMFKAKPLEGEDPVAITWKYDVVWSAPQRNTEDNYNQAPSSNTGGSIPEYDIDEDEIPF